MSMSVAVSGANCVHELGISFHVFSKNEYHVPIAIVLICLHYGSTFGFADRGNHGLIRQASLTPLRLLRVATEKGIEAQLIWAVTGVEQSLS